MASLSGRYPANGGIAARLEQSRPYAPLRSVFETTAVAFRTLKLAALPPYSWVGDAVVEADRMIKRCLVPLVISQVIWITGFGILNFGEVTAALGLADRQPGGVLVGYTREVSTWITMMILAGVAGSAVTADLASRKIREELDALAVLGVDQLRLLIVPRVVAMVFAAVILGVIGLFAPLTANFLFFPPLTEITHSVWLESMAFNTHAQDIFVQILKHVVMSFFIAIVACQQGLAAKGGADGVGVAVTRTVIVTFFGIWLINSLWNTAYLPSFPDVNVPKG